MIQLTDKAVIKAKEIAESEGCKPSIRLQVRGGGCSGFINDMFFDEIIHDTDEVFNFQGITIIIDQMSYQYLQNATLDYVESEFATGFKFILDNIKGSCGCGSSVSY